MPPGASKHGDSSSGAPLQTPAGGTGLSNDMLWHRLLCQLLSLRQPGVICEEVKVTAGQM
ncbi:hypothetical protein EYF80_013071 [Liparis tanakae]|uniref:Uncharacterized protein n=1 Tax=Liparis tanakae TaxID=230148 RepID=A0A4Z2IEZ2_9TELE|nr:hypothetical protein EYF80_013071 [Liparis tanakae]